MNDRIIRQRGFFFGMVLILAVLALILVWQFIQAILLALALVILLKPLYNRFLGLKWTRGSAKTATALTLVVFILLIAIPAVVIIGGAISQAALLFSGLNIEGLDFSLSGINTWVESLVRAVVASNVTVEDIDLTETISAVVIRINFWLRTILINLSRSLPGFFTNGFIVLVILYVLLPRYRGIGKQEILQIVPFPLEITQLFLDKIDLMVKAMFKGTFVIAILQGLAMGAILWLAGVPYALFLTLISMLLALVPLIGISLVAWPIGIFLILNGNFWQGVFVIAMFLLFVVNIETFMRPILIPKGAQLNPALVILSVIGGLRVMGIIGALYGPVVMILLVTSLDVYTKYLLRADLEALDREGRIDLKELGLVQAEDRQEPRFGEMIYTVLKNVTAPLRREAAAPAQHPDEAADPVQPV